MVENGETTQGGAVSRLWLLGLLPVLALTVKFAWGPCDHFMLTGHFFPVEKVDVLQSPQEVTGWTADVLQLVDGSRVRLPGLTTLPAQSEALKEATASGVEVTPDGEVYGLLKIHHWCGNDPVRKHAARISLSRLLIFLREGEPKNGLSKEMSPSGGRFDYSEFGWNVSEYLMFRAFEDQLKFEKATRSVP